MRRRRIHSGFLILSFVTLLGAVFFPVILWVFQTHGLPVPLGYDPLHTPLLKPVSSIDLGGPLLVSDSPEYVKQSGVLYSDRVQGPFRLFLHHINKSGQPLRFMVVFSNPTKHPTHLVVRRRGIGRSGRISMVGKLALNGYMQKQEIVELDIPAQGQWMVEDELSARPMAKNETVNGIYDFETGSVPLKLRVIAIPTTELTTGGPTGFEPLIPSDSVHKRGRFPHTLRELRFSFDAVRPSRIGLADGENDPYLIGKDPASGEKIQIRGNYGLLYDITVKILPRRSRELRIYLNPRGGSFAGALRILTNQQERVTNVPNWIPGFGNQGNGVLLGSYQLQKGHPLTVRFQLMPPGAGNLPADLLFVPGN